MTNHHIQRLLTPPRAGAADAKVQAQIAEVVAALWAERGLR